MWLFKKEILKDKKDFEVEILELDPQDPNIIDYN
jgi:hypothetical protein